MNTEFHHCSTSPSCDSKPQGFFWYTGWLVFLLVLYVLSIGPVAWLENWTPLVPGGFYDVLYKPLSVISDHSVPVSRFFDWYECEVWGVVHSMDHPVPSAFNL